MSQSFMWRHADYQTTRPGLFWVCNGSVCHLDARLRDALLDAGVRVITSSNYGVYDSMLHAINRPDGF